MTTQSSALSTGQVLALPNLKIYQNGYEDNQTPSTMYNIATFKQMQALAERLKQKCVIPLQIEISCRASLASWSEQEGSEPLFFYKDDLSGMTITRNDGKSLNKKERLEVARVAQEIIQRDWGLSKTRIELRDDPTTPMSIVTDRFDETRTPHNIVADNIFRGELLTPFAEAHPEETRHYQQIKFLDTLLEVLKEYPTDVSS